MEEKFSLITVHGAFWKLSVAGSKQLGLVHCLLLRYLRERNSDLVSIKFPGVVLKGTKLGLNRHMVIFSYLPVIVQDQVIDRSG